MFVTAETAAICPTPAEALTGDCGNTVEDSARGYRRLRGQTVDVTSTTAEDGVLPAVRWMMAGELPGWVDAGRVAPKPNLAELEQFRAALPMPRLFETPEGPGPGPIAYSGRQHTGISLAAMRAVSGEPRPTSPPILLFEFETPAGAQLIGVELPDCLQTSAGVQFHEFHDCLLNADCLTTEYLCDDDYCDEVLFTGQWTERTVETPGWPGDGAPLIEATTLADRFGVFAAGTCD